MPIKTLVGAALCGGAFAMLGAASAQADWPPYEIPCPPPALSDERGLSCDWPPAPNGVSLHCAWDFVNGYICNYQH